MSLPRHPWLAAAGLVGLAVLAVSLVSARYFLHGPSAESPGEPPPARSGGVRSLGTVDVESGLVPLAPAQPGEIIEIPVKEGQNVKKGDPLLRLDDALWRAKLMQAQAGVAEAEAELQRAQQGVAAYPSLVAAQRAKVEARKKELEAAQAKVRRVEGLRDIKQANDDDLKQAGDAAAALGAGVRAEEEALRALEANRPEPLVTKAQAAVARYQALQTEAQIALDKCVLRAPTDGTILQILVGVGAGFNPQNATRPAFWFRPAGSPLVVRADVEQEFAAGVAVDQPVVITDESRHTLTWKGRVIRVPDVFLPKRAPSTSTIPMPLSASDSRVLECLILVEPSNGPPPRVGQRVRVMIGP